MSDHDKLYEIIQKAFNAGQNFSQATFLAIQNGSDLPAAYPVITPLIEELVKYCDDQIDNETEACAWIAEEQSTTWAAYAWAQSCESIARIIRLRALAPKDRYPSSPFRSVEIRDGKVVE